MSAGANVKAAQHMLGHAKASMTLDATRMTLDVYSDLFPEDLDAVDAFDKALSEQIAGEVWARS